MSAHEPASISRTPWVMRRVGNLGHDGNPDADIYEVYSAKGHALTQPLFRRDARLIHAAPGLIEALNQLLDLTDDLVSYLGDPLSADETAILTKARAALAAACGEKL